MGCFETKEAPEEKKDKEKGAKKKGASKDPLEKWSYETVEEKPWKMPSKDEFMSRFSTGEDDPAAARKRMLAFLNTKDAKNETKVYLPGELDNFDVTFEGCENCDFYILDLSSQIQVDDCIGCRFFIAPCTGSIFIRNCTNCSVAVAASQVRLRDCKDCVLMLFVPGRSVLEECRGTSVACWNVSYFQLRVQFARARLSIFDNGWWRFNDFGTNSAPRILPAGTSLEDVMRKEEKPWKQLHEIAPGIINAGADVDLAVPLTSGSTPSADACFVLFSPGLSLQASQVALHCSGGKGGDGLDVVACREFGRLGDPEIARLFPDLTKFGKDTGKAKTRRDLFMKGPVVGLHLVGPASTVQALLAPSDVCILGKPDPSFSADITHGQVYIWEGSETASVASYFLHELRHGLDG